LMRILSHNNPQNRKRKLPISSRAKKFSKTNSASLLAEARIYMVASFGCVTSLFDI
jgi:hypothetical protein